MSSNSAYLYTPTTEDLDNLLGLVGVGLWQWEETTGKFSLDTACRDILDLQPGEEASKEYLVGLLNEEDLANYKQALEDCFETGKFTVEYSIRCRNGELRHISGRGQMLFTDETNARVIKGVFIDITQNKELKTQLKSSKERMRQLADEIPGLFSYIDRNYRVQFMNSRYRETLGCEEDGVIGQHIRNLIGPEAFLQRQKRYELALAGKDVLFETNVLSSEGENRYFTIRHCPHRNNNGEVLGIMTLAMDITNRRKIERQLENQASELERSNHDLEQFAYVASHDLKAPLRSIEALAEWLQEDLQDYQEGDVQDNLGQLRQRAVRLNRLLDDLLTYAKAGKENGEANYTDTRIIVNDIVSLLDAPKTMQVVADKSLPMLITHHAPLEQVLRNLIGNAIQHHPSEVGNIRVYAQDQGDSVMFAVEDDGAGIKEENAEKAFKMFKTLQPRDQRDGNGMGLAIVKRIVECQGGRVWFHAGPEQKGTVFKFLWQKNATQKNATQENSESASAAIDPQTTHQNLVS